MDYFLEQLFTGLGNGAIYSSLALALVLIYQSTGLINFAQGEMATLSAYIFFTCIVVGLTYWVALIVTLGVSFLYGAGIYAAIIRPARNRPEFTQVVLFIALLLIINALTGWIWGHDVQSVDSPFESWTWLDMPYLSAHIIGTFGVVMGALAGLMVLFRFTRFGLGLRAAARHPNEARLVGISVVLMLTMGWGLAAALGALAGMLIAPEIFLSPDMMIGVLIYGFAAALVGGIDNPIGAVLGGLSVGVLEALLGAYVMGGNLKLTLALMTITVVLLIKPQGLLGARIVVKV